MKFKRKDLEKFWENPASNQSRYVPSNLHKILYRKLQMLSAAVTLDDLKIPPGNRLESLKGNRSGQYSIRVNDQWRLCFEWKDGEAVGVEFCDYHK